MFRLPYCRPSLRLRRGHRRRETLSIRGRCHSLLAVEALELRQLLTSSVDLALDEAVEPLGSLIYDSGEVRSLLEIPGDVQTFTLAVDSGQTLTVLVEPGASLRPTVELRDPANVILANTTGNAAGENILLQTIPATAAGTYTLSLGQAAGTVGELNVRVILNAAEEEEDLLGISNNTRSTAQPLDNAFLPLGSQLAGTSPPERAAVVGRVQGGAAAGDVYFSELYGGDVVQLDSAGNLRGRISHPLLSSGYPSDVEQGVDNDLYVAVTAYDGSGRLLRFDYAGDLLNIITLPSDNGIWSVEMGLDVAADGSLWVTQSSANAIYHLDSSGNVLANIPSAVQGPLDVAVRGDGQLLVSGQSDVSGQWTSGVWNVDPVTGNATLFAEVAASYGINLTPDGDLTVGGLNDGIHRFDSVGTPLPLIPRYSATDPQADSLNNVWSTMLYSGVVEKFDSAGNLLAMTPAYYPWGLAVIGADGPEPGPDLQPDPGDFYSLTLDTGQSLTLALKTPSAGQLALELQDANGTVLAAGVADADNVDTIIRNFVAPEAGSYFVRVSGQKAEYSLVATRDADFDTERNDDIWAPQALSGTDVALGFIANDRGPGYGVSSFELNIGGGGVFDPVGNQFTGTIDEVAIWDVALADSQVADMFNAALIDGGNFAQAVLQTDPIAYWRFNEAGGETAINLGKAGATLDGTYVGGQRGAVGPDSTLGQPLPGLEADNIAYRVGPDESFVHVPASPLSKLEQFSLSAWVNRDALLNSRIGLVGQNDAIEFGFISPDVIQIWTPNGGQADYYLSPDELPAGQWFHLAAVGNGNWLTLYINGQAVQYGGWSIPSGTQDADSYQFEVNEGDALVVQTQTPAGDPLQPGRFHNVLDPAIELYDPWGNQVAVDDNSGADGKNAVLMHTALTTGAYRVRVLGAQESRGEYVLKIDGATGDLPEFNVVATDLPDGSRIRGPRTQLTVDFSDAILQSSIEASDLTLDGIPADAVTVVDGNTVVFELPLHGEGLHEIRIEENALADLQGTPLSAFRTTFYEDITPPHVVATSIQQGDVLPTGSLEYTVEFSEEMYLGAFDNWDFELRSQYQGASYYPDSSSWDVNNTRLTLRYGNLPDDSYTLTLLSGDFLFEDLVGFDLDGERLASPLPPNQSGDGIEGGNFSLNFSLDVDTVPFPAPLVAQRPLGSLVYEASVRGAIASELDSDTYTLSVDPGQTITVVVNPTATLQPKVELFRANGKKLQKLVSDTADAAGEDAVLQTFFTAGSSNSKPQTYHVKISGANGSSGGYATRMILNAAVENESHNRGTNDSRDTAQNLTPSLIPLHTASLDGAGPARAAVLGKIRSGVSAGDTIFAEIYGGGLVQVNSAGQGVARITNAALSSGYLFDVEQGIHDDLYVSMVPYSGGGRLLHFDLEGQLLSEISLPDGYYWDLGLDVAADGSLWVTQVGTNQVHHLDASGNALASYAISAGYPVDVAVRADGQVFVTSVSGGGVWQLDPDTGALNQFAVVPYPYGLNFAPDGELTVAGFYDGIYRFDNAGTLLSLIPQYSTVDPQVDPQNDLWSTELYGYRLQKFDPTGNPVASASAYYPWGLAVIGSDGPAPSATLQPDSGDFYSLKLTAGQSLTLALKSLTYSQVSMELQDATGATLTIGASNATNADQMIRSFVAPAKGTYYVRVSGDPNAEYSLTATRSAEFDTEWNSDFSATQDVVSSKTAGRQWVLGFLGAQEEWTGQGDLYRVTLDQRTTLELETKTPADGGGDVFNRLNPLLRVYDASGNLVAFNDDSAPDGRNARLSYRVPRGAGGTYFVEVVPSEATAERAEGEYVLSIKGGSEALPPFRVVGAVPGDGNSSRGPTQQLTVSFNDALLLTSVQAADLTINGIPAVGVSVLDAKTAIFELPKLNEGPQHVRIASGAITDLQGTPLIAYETTFFEDVTPPRIISSSIQSGDVLPAGDVTYVVEFSEPMRTDVDRDGDTDANDLDWITGGITMESVNDGNTFYYAPNALSFSASGTTMTISYSSLPEDHYRLKLSSFALEDSADPDGFNLDGEALASPVPPAVSGDGIEGGDFIVEFDLDIETAPFPVPLAPIAPLGSLIYDGTVTGLIRPSGDSDTWTISLDAGQTVTAVVAPSGSLQAIVKLFDPAAGLLGSFSSALAGQDAVLQATPALTAGTYTVSVGGVGATSGSFQLRIILNSAVESESHGGPANDTQATAQDLNTSFISLDSSDGPQRAAVLGHVQAGTVSGDLFFAEQFSGTVVQLDSAGNEINRITHPELSRGSLMDIEQGAGDDLYVAMIYESGYGGQLLHFDLAGQLLETIPLPDLYFYETGLDVAADGSFWLTQPTGNEVLHLDSSGNPLASYPVPVSYPLDVAVREDGQVFVTSVYSWGIWQLDPATGDSSQFASVPYPYGLNFAPNGDLTVAGITSGIYRFDGAGNQLQYIFADYPIDAQVDPLDQIWAQSFYGGYVAKYDSAGNRLFSVPASYSRALAVIGVDGPAPGISLAPDSGDIYSLTLAAGQRLTVAIQRLSSGKVSLELQDASGTVLAQGTADADNPDLVIRDFGATESGTYYLRVTGDRGVEYSLVATREASFEVEPNNSIAAAQDLGAPGIVLGAIQKEVQSFVESHRGGLFYNEHLLAAGNELFVVSRGSYQIMRYDLATGAPKPSEGNDGAVFATGAGLNNPIGITRGPDGNLYVGNLDSWNVTIFDGTTGVYLGEFISAESGESAGKTGLVFGPDGNLYVISTNAQVLRYHGPASSTPGEFMDVFISAGSGGLTHSDHLAFGPDGNLYVSSQYDNRVLRYQGPSGLNPGEFIDTFVDGAGLEQPTGIAFGADGDLYVASQLAGQVLHYQGPLGAQPGQFVNVVIGSGEAGLSYPTGLAFDADGNLYVSSQGTSSVVRSARIDDFYRVTLTIGEQLTAATTTPGDEPGEFVNDLDPILRLYDSDGQLIAEDDNGAADGRNAVLNFIPSADGAYYVQMTSANQSTGEYVLTLLTSPAASSAIPSVIAPTSTPARVPGDVNFDGVFDSSDLVQVFQAGEYEDGITGNSNYEEGDWNGDGDFDSSDLVEVFQRGNYVEQANRRIDVSKSPRLASNTDAAFAEDKLWEGGIADDLVSNLSPRDLQHA